MELLIIIIVIVLVIYFIGKTASGKSSPQQSQEPSYTDDEDGIVVSSGTGASIVIQVSGSEHSRFRQRRLKPVNPWTWGRRSSRQGCNPADESPAAKTWVSGLHS